MDTLSLASKLSVYNPEYSKVSDSMMVGANYQIERFSKRFHQHSPKTLTDPLKSLWNPLTKNGNQLVK